jgi:hypothetical protein
MSIDPNLDAWRRQWQQASAEPDNGVLALELEKRVISQTRRLKLGLIVPILVTLIIGGGVPLNALRTGQVADIVMAVESWFFILVTWAGCLWIARGTWRAYGETTAAFVDISIRRCRANLSTIPFALWLYAGQFFVVTLLKVQYSPASVGAVLTSWPVLLIGGVGFPALVAGSYWYGRKQQAELKYLLDLRRQLSDG